MTSRTRSPFYRVETTDSSRFPTIEGITFEAEFPLPDDGTPDTFNRLVLVVVLEEPDSQVAHVYTVSRTGWLDKGERRQEDRFIGECREVPIEHLDNLLYGFAVVKTKNYLEIR